MYKLLLSFICVFSFCRLQAQEKIDTDRPDQTESAVLVPMYFFQGEIGFNKENLSEGNYTLVYPTALLKYGLSRRFELRLETNMVATYEKYIPQTKITRGVEPVTLGFKAALWEEKNARPKTSVIVHAALPGIASENFKARHVAPSFRFTMQHSLSETVGLGYNAGAEWDGFSGTPAWLYTLAPGVNFGDNWYAYAEVFGFIKPGALPEHSADAGIAYFFNDNLKADLSAGAGISKAAPDHYVAIGFSFRFNTRK